MADTLLKYNHSLKLIANKEIDLTAIKVMLLGAGAAFDAAHTTLNEVAGAAAPHRANELYGNGWAEGGELLTGVVLTTVLTSGVMLDANDIRKTATGGPIPPGGTTQRAVMFDDAHASKQVLFWITLEAPRQAGEFVDFLLKWHANGIVRIAWA